MPHRAARLTPPTFPSEMGDLAPLRAFEADLMARLHLLKEDAPASDAVASLTRTLAGLRTALAAARSGRQWVMVAEVARQTGLTAQAITARCRSGFYPGAEKDGGLWKIPRACFLPRAVDEAVEERAA